MILKAIAVIKEMKKSKAKGNLIVIEILTCFSCFFDVGFSQVMYTTSFNFNL